MMPRINLLPERLRGVYEYDWRRSLRRFLLVTVVLIFLVGAGGFCVWAGRQVLDQTAQLNAVNARLQALAPTLAKIEALEKDRVQTEEKVTFFQKLMDNRQVWPKVLTEVKTKMPREIWLTEIALNDKGVLEIKGYAASFTSVGEYLLSLSTGPLVNEAALKIAQEETLDQRQVVYFEIVCSRVANLTADQAKTAAGSIPPNGRGAGRP
ncbi:MAG: hypothetical protein HPY81_01780 [Firmicutes bacterium]|nr:hypothetical protein [Bacillota bacterium]